MAISFVANSATANTGANPTVTYPGSIVNDDFLIIVTAGSATTSTPTGWTQITAEGAGQFITAFYKFYNSSTDTTPVALTNAGTTTVATMLAYRGVGLHDVVGSYATATGTSLATTSQTTLLANDRVISIYANAQGGARTWTAPGSTTTLVNTATTSTTRGLLIVDEAKATAGATTTRTATISNSSALASVSISIREPQTLYWRGSSGTWSSTSKTNWAISSGGTGSIAVPNRLDTVVFDNNSNTTTGAFTVTASAAIVGSVTFGSGASALDGAMTLAMGTSTIDVAGSWANPASNFAYSGTGTITFSGLSAQTIDTNGISLVSAVVFDGIGGSWQLQRDFTTSSAQTITLTNGTLNLNNYNVTCGFFSSNNANSRTLTSGTGQFYLTSTNQGATKLWDNGNAVSITFTDIPTINLNNAGSTGTRGILNGPTASSSAVINVNVTAGGDTVEFTGQSYNNVNFTGFTGSWLHYTMYIYGSLTMSTGMSMNAGSATYPLTFASTTTGNTITFNGKTHDGPITFNGVGGSWILQDNLTTTSTRTVTLTNGTLDLNNNVLSCGLFNAANTNTKVIAFGSSGYITTTGTGTALSITGTGFTYTGTSRIDISNNSATATTVTLNTGFTESNALNINITTGTYTLTETATTPTYRNLNLTGFSGTFPTSVRTIYGSLTLSSGLTMAAGGGNTTTFAATSGTHTITSNGKTLDFPVTFNGVGGTWQLVGALTVASGRTVTLTNGSIDLNNNDFTCGYFSSNNSNTRNITSGTGQFYLTGSNAYLWRTDTATGLTYTGTPTVNMTYTGSAGTRLIINCNTGGGSPSLALNLNVPAGSDIFQNGTGSWWNNVSFVGASTQYSGAAQFGGFVTGNLTFSSTMTQSTVNSFQFNNVTGGTQVFTTNGITVDSPVGIASRSTTTAASGDGTTATLTFTGSHYVYPVGSTINVSGVVPDGYNGTYTVTACTLTSVSYLNTTTGAQTTAGYVANYGATVSLADPLTMGSTRTLTFNGGTFLLNNHNISIGAFLSSGTNVRTINFGSAAVTVTGNSTNVWRVDSGTNLTYTYTATPNIYATYSGSTGTRGFLNASAYGNPSHSVNLYVTAGSDLITAGSLPSFYNNVDFTGYSGAAAFFGVIQGDITFSSTMTNSTTGTITFQSANNQVQKLYNNGINVDQPIVVGAYSPVATSASGNGSVATLSYATQYGAYLPVGATIVVTGFTPSAYNGTYTITAANTSSISYASTATGTLVTGGRAYMESTLQLQGNIVSSSARSFNMTSGNIDMQNYNISTGTFLVGGSGNPRSITTTGGEIFLSGSGTTVASMQSDSSTTLTGGPINVHLTYAGSTGTRTITGTTVSTKIFNYFIENGSDTVNITVGRAYNDIDFTGFTGTVGLTGTVGSAVSVYGNFAAPSFGGTIATDTSHSIYFYGSSDTTLTTNGTTINIPLFCSKNAGWKVSLVGDFSSSQAFTVSSGTFDASNYNVTIPNFASSGTSTRQVIMGSGTWTFNGTSTIWNTGTKTNLTVSGASANIVISDSSTAAKTWISGGGFTFGNLTFTGSNVYTMTFSYADTWGTWASTKTSAFTIGMAGGSTTTVSDWTINGSAGNIVSLTSSIPGTTARISKSSGTVSVSYMDILDSTAQGGATWLAYLTNNNTNSGNNTGWKFYANSGNFLMLF